MNKDFVTTPMSKKELKQAEIDSGGGFMDAKKFFAQLDKKTRENAFVYEFHVGTIESITDTIVVIAMKTPEGNVIRQEFDKSTLLHDNIIEGQEVELAMYIATR